MLSEYNTYANMVHSNLVFIVKGRFSLAPGVKVIMPECLAVSWGGGPCFLQGCIIPTIILAHKGLTLPCYSSVKGGGGLQAALHSYVTTSFSCPLSILPGFQTMLTADGFN